jgi:hypothetical protein
MLKFHESLISAHHNYLVNEMLSPGFLLGDPGRKENFWFLADVVLPGDNEAQISGRLYDTQRRFLLELRRSTIVENPGHCQYQSTAGGFRILCPSGEVLLDVHTESFANGFLTRIQGELYDREGKLRIEPCYDAIQIHGEARLVLERPFLKR